MPKIMIDTEKVAYVILDEDQKDKMKPQVTFVCSNVIGKGSMVELSFENMKDAAEAYESIGDCGTQEVTCYGISLEAK